MSLDSGKLYRGFLRWFRVPQGIRTYRQAEAKFSQIYHGYAQGAEDVSGECPDNLDRGKFERPLSFETGQARQRFARQIESAFVAYWTGVTFPILVVPPATPPCPNVGGNGIFGAELSSLVLSVTAGAMYSAVLPILSKGEATADEAARRLADVMDSVTKSAVTILITGQDTTPGGGGGPLPITNTCTVF